MVPPDSYRIPRVRYYLGYLIRVNRVSATGVSPSVPGFPTPFTYAINFLLFEPTAVGSNWSLNPDTATPAGLTQYWFGLFRVRSPLLTESRLFSLPVGTEMFHFPTFPLSTLYIQVEITRHYSGWVSPFGNPRIKARLTAPRGLSQPTTSFIGF